VRPPFGAPARPIPPQADFHFPSTESDERASLPGLELVSVSGTTTAELRNTATGESATLRIGATQWGWELLDVSDVGEAADAGEAVVEHDFDEWSELRYLARAADGTTATASVRKPVGRVASISQPLYNFADFDKEYHCKQDIDPTDWMGRLAANMSGGEEASPGAAGTLMAPNTDSGLLGNPEDHSKFVLTHRSALQSTPFPGSGRTLWTLAGSGLLPAGCQAVVEWEQVKMGYAGNLTHYRVVNQGLWHPASDGGGGGCGIEILAVSPPTIYDAAGNRSLDTSALLRVTAHVLGAVSNASITTYLHVTVADDGAGAVHVANLGGNGSEFYAAVRRQATRWDQFVATGATAAVPRADRRYTATATGLLTMFMNNDRGLIPIYGSGQFW